MTINISQDTLTVDVVTSQPTLDIVTDTLSLDVASGGLVPANIDLAAEAGENLSALRVVRLNGTNKAVYADNDNATNANAVGITTSSAASGATASIRYAGLLEDSSWTWSQGPIYIGTAGTLTQAAPTGGLIVREVARAIASTKIIIDIETLIQTV